MNYLPFVAFCFLFFTSGYTDPSVTLTSCKANTATVTVTDVEAGKIMFFRTDTAYNMITTPGGTVIHACSFDDCNIKWNEKFYIVIQRHIMYQTSEDFVIWLVCTSDSNSINAISFEFSSFQVVENLTTITYKPEVAMSFYKGGIRLNSRGEVKLGDYIQMIIRVTNNDNDYFDISAKSCYASGITLIEDKCPVTEELFSAFNSTAVGYLSNTFSMFRPTSNSGGPFEVVFTCILEVCLWNCDEYICSSDETPSSSTRRKRSTNVRPADGQKNPSVVRGFTLTAVAEGEEINFDNKKPRSDELCIPVSIIATLAAVFVFIVGSSSAITSISFNYYCNYAKSILEVKEQKDGKNKLVLNECQPLSKTEHSCTKEACDVGFNISKPSKIDHSRSDGQANKICDSSSELSQRHEHVQELKAHLQTRTGRLGSYRRKSIPIAGIPHYHEHQFSTYK